MQTCDLIFFSVRHLVLYIPNGVLCSLYCVLRLVANRRNKRYPRILAFVGQRTTELNCGTLPSLASQGSGPKISPTLSRPLAICSMQSTVQESRHERKRWRSLYLRSTGRPSWISHSFTLLLLVPTFGLNTMSYSRCRLWSCIYREQRFPC